MPTNIRSTCQRCGIRLDDADGLDSLCSLCRSDAIASVIAEAEREPPPPYEYRCEWGYGADLAAFSSAIDALCRAGWRPHGPLLTVRDDDGDILLLRELIRTHPQGERQEVRQ